MVLENAKGGYLELIWGGNLLLLLLRLSLLLMHSRQNLMNARR